MSLNQITQIKFCSSLIFTCTDNLETEFQIKLGNKFYDSTITFLWTFFSFSFKEYKN